ncbi:MAG: hypothetical protein Q9177_004290 [Variospora cf. flavescens]
MKRPNSDDVMDLNSHTSKKMRPETLYHNIDPDPTTPTDDLDDDDLYGDSSAIAQDRIQTPLSQTKAEEQQLSPPQGDPQEHNIFQLPGLNLSMGRSSGPYSSNHGGRGPAAVQDSTSVIPNVTLPTTEQEQSFALPLEVKANGSQAISQDQETAQEPSNQHHSFSAVSQYSKSQDSNTANGQAAGVELNSTGTPTVGQNKLAAASSTYTPTSEVGESVEVQLDTEDHVIATETTPELPQQTSRQKDNEQEHAQNILDSSKSYLPSPLQNLEAVDEAKDAQAELGHRSLSPPRSIELQIKQMILQASEEQWPAQPQGVIATVSEGGPTVQDSAELDERDKKTAPSPVPGMEQKDRKTTIESLEPGQPPKFHGTEVAITATSKTIENGTEADANADEAEFEIDSSPIESSSESDSDSSSSSAADSDYVMLNPEEEARRLMEEHGGSDDESKGSKATSGPLRTLNEKPDEVVPKPQIEVTPAMAIAELGSVEQVVENSILIKAKTSGERQALEAGSLLCLGDRSVIGVIAEILGQVQQPYYSVRFTNSAAIVEAGIVKGTSIFNVEQHSQYVFTQNIKAFKGSDASNIHDEEVGDDELEFSDDEAEAEHKRRVKQERLARRGGRSDRGDGFTRGSRGVRTQPSGRSNQGVDRDRQPPPISYDEQDDGEDLYTPLARPSNLHEFMGHGEAPQENLVPRVNSTSRGHDPRRGKPDRGKGRGERGHGHGSRGGRGNRRGGAGYNGDFPNHQSNNPRQLQHHNPPSHAHPAPPPPSSLPNQHPSFPSTQNVHLPASPYAWSNAHPSHQYNPLYGHSPQQATPFYQQPAYTNHNPHAYQYPQMNATPQSLPFPQHHQYPPHQAASPTTPAPPHIPPGAHINPAFFSPTSQQSPESWPKQQAHGGGSRSPQSEAAFLAAQDRLKLLRQLSQGGTPQR